MATPLSSIMPSPSIVVANAPQRESIKTMPAPLIDYLPFGKYVDEAGGVHVYRYSTWMTVEVASELIDARQLKVVANDGSSMTIAIFGNAIPLPADRVYIELSMTPDITLTVNAMNHADRIEVPREAWAVTRYSHPDLRRIRLTSGAYSLIAGFQRLIMAGNYGTTIWPVPQMCRIVAEQDAGWSHKMMSNYEITTALRAAPVATRPALYEQIHVGALYPYFDIDRVAPSDLESGALERFVDRVRDMLREKYDAEARVVCWIATELKYENPGAAGTMSLHLVFMTPKLFRSPQTILRIANEHKLFEAPAGDARPWLLADAKVYNLMQKYRLDAAPKKPRETRVFKLVDYREPFGEALEPEGQLLVQAFEPGVPREFYDSEVLLDTGVVYSTTADSPHMTDLEFDTTSALVRELYGKVPKRRADAVLRALCRILKQRENSARVFKLFHSYFVFAHDTFNSNDITGRVPGDGHGSSVPDPVRLWNRTKSQGLGYGRPIEQQMSLFESLYYHADGAVREREIEFSLHFDLLTRHFCGQSQMHFGEIASLYNYSYTNLGRVWHIFNYNANAATNLRLCVTAPNGTKYSYTGPRGQVHIEYQDSGVWMMVQGGPSQVSNMHKIAGLDEPGMLKLTLTIAEENA